MARDTLNLQGDEDLEGAIESVFSVKFTDEEFASMITVGAIHDVINIRMPPRDGACQTSMTFYRLRRGLIELGMPAPIRPDTPLLPAFSLRTKDRFRALAEVTGLQLPQIEGGPLATACFLAVLTAFILFAVGLMLQVTLLGWISASSIVAAFVFGKLDRGRLPKHLSTVGALAQRTAPVNFGRLVAGGSRVNGSMTWDALCDAISDVAEIEPGEIGRDTLIYPRRRAAA